MPCKIRIIPSPEYFVALLKKAFLETMAWGPGGFPHKLRDPAGDQAGFPAVSKAHRRLFRWSRASWDAAWKMPQVIKMPPMGCNYHGLGQLIPSFSMKNIEIFPKPLDTSHDNLENIWKYGIWNFGLWNFHEFSMKFNGLGHHQRSPRQLLMMIQSHAASGHTIFAALQVLGAPRTAIQRWLFMILDQSVYDGHQKWYR